MSIVACNMQHGTTTIKTNIFRKSRTDCSNLLQLTNNCNRTWIFNTPTLQNFRQCIDWFIADTICQLHLFRGSFHLHMSPKQLHIQINVEHPLFKFQSVTNHQKFISLLKFINYRLFINFIEMTTTSYWFYDFDWWYFKRVRFMFCKLYIVRDLYPQLFLENSKKKNLIFKGALQTNPFQMGFKSITCSMVLIV